MSYEAMHFRLKQARGPARNYLCPCGKQAQDWAYQGSRNERVDRAGRKYSINPDDYAPMCHPCHCRLDRFTAVTHCPQGHEYAGDNLLNGKYQRYRTCAKEEWRARTPEQMARYAAAERERYYARKRRTA